MINILSGADIHTGLDILSIVCQYVSCHVKSRPAPRSINLSSSAFLGESGIIVRRSTMMSPYPSKAATEGLGLIIKKEADHKKVSLFLVNMS